MYFLVISSELPYPDQTSAGLRLFTLLQLLRSNGHRVDYFLLAPFHEVLNQLGESEFNRYHNLLTRDGISLLHGSIDTSLRHNSFDAVIFEYYFTAKNLINKVRLWNPKARIIIDSVDINYLRWQAKAELSGAEADLIFAQSVEASELEVYRHSDLVLTLTENESQELKCRIPNIKTFQVPNIHPDITSERAESISPEILFIGSFSHQPNIDAVHYFYNQIWPLIQQARPDTTWTIIGASPPDDILLFQGHGIQIMGWVPDTTPFLSRCWVSLAPLRFGAGMKGKVGEAMAFGVPVVSSSFGAQGLGATNGLHILIEDSPARFANAVIRLLNDKEYRLMVGNNGRTLIEDRFSRKSVSQSIPYLIDFISEIPINYKLACPWVRRVVYHISNFFTRHLGWRLKSQK